VRVTPTVLVAAVVSVLGLASCSSHHSASPAVLTPTATASTSITAPGTSTPSSTGSPSTGSPSTGSSSTVPSTSSTPPRGSASRTPGAAAKIACPHIVDSGSRLTYDCIDDSLVLGAADSSLGLQVVLSKEVEPNWVLTEGSGNSAAVLTKPGTLVAVTSATVQATVQKRTRDAIAEGYGDNPSSKQLSAAPITLAGVTGYELVSEITIDPTYRAANDLTVRTERLWVLGVPVGDTVSVFVMSVPDDRSDLWPKAQAIVAGVRVS
jgi:hypothetical protein